MWADIDYENLHGFDRLMTSFMLTEIFTFLNLGNVKTLLNVNKRFRTHLLKADNRNLRTVGHYTYGLSKIIIIF